ncbi:MULTISPECIES: osmoprotectant ABC transporter substrate-binding protein [Paenibacillus]|uniref:Substrate-binding region of ABC-type glycine betaine transport system n=2 Tax=Paenibacillus lactis TaxID=228574 RepID=G4H9I6_9BACL|nr:osmoprotectant ABC transporter substrate-binding protein [Paenibacillus lactis]EHB68521.1 Substrate-binding region of ABC-type glycine betaine transport system [Paenibacillus lactis 154]MBP1893449.1 osmoprotectant transport system substrate-binding protein [Paenibacillus lactis]
MSHISRRQQTGRNKEGVMNLNKLRWIPMLACMLTLAAFTSACGIQSDMTIGTQTYTETKIIAEMYKALIEDQTDLNVDIIPDLASSSLVINAMKDNDVQMATLYTGEIFNNHFPISGSKDRAKVLKEAQEGFQEHFGFTWMNPLGFENTYAFTVRKDLAETNGYTKISDVKKDMANMKLGVDTTWLERSTDGYPAFSKAYGITFGQVFPMEISLVYSAVANQQVDIVLAYSTDSRLKAYELQTLKDDKQFFPPYDASPVLRSDLLKKHPEIEEAIAPLIGRLDADTMISLNYQVDIEKKSEREVAIAYLKEQGLLNS